MATRAPQRLSGSDMSNLHAERGPIHVHVGGTMIVEGAAPSYQRLVAHVEKRLLLVPRFRQRIVKIPLGIENPVWGDDPQFDARRHVRHRREDEEWKIVHRHGDHPPPDQSPPAEDSAG